MVPAVRRRPLAALCRRFDGRGRAFRPRQRLWLLAAVLPALAVCVPAGAAARNARSGSGLLFNGSNKSAWFDQSATSTRIRRVSNPAGTGTALRFQTYNQDVFPLTPTSNPRAQLVAPLPISVGDQFWESYEVYLPRSFPVAATYHGWLALGSPAYGAPWAGSPPVELAINDGHFRFQRDGYAAYPWQIAWQAPLVLGRWVRFTWHVQLSRTGFVQLYMDNQPLELSNGSSASTTLFMPVLDPSDDRGPWVSTLQVYYRHDEFPQVTVYFRDFRIARTEALAVGN